MSSLKLAFERMGASIELAESRRSPFAIDIKNTKEGEVFEISGQNLLREDIKILDVEPENRHLLLMWKERETGTKHKFLCGHDERHWFVAAVPDIPAKGKTGTYGVKNVGDAMEALKPEAVRAREKMVGLKGQAKRERHNAARKRQGEWFFVPLWNSLSVKSPILKNEPIQRGRAKPHLCEFLIRQGGTRVMVSREYPNGLDMKDYEKLIRKDKKAKGLRWTPRVADAKVFVRGRISHPDHETLNLGSTWHEVHMNTESEAPSMRHLRFLD